MDLKFITISDLIIAQTGKRGQIQFFAPVTLGIN
jgi:hypothetical protein